MALVERLGAATFLIPLNRGRHEVRAHLGSRDSDPGSGCGAALSSPARW